MSNGRSNGRSDSRRSTIIMRAILRDPAPNTY
jgi:hypothetical protein